MTRGYGLQWRQNVFDTILIAGFLHSIAPFGGR